MVAITGGGVCRITSYNVCYTKLLRRDDLLISFSVEPADTTIDHPRTRVLVDGDDLSGKLLIADSYNFV